ncbi:hypothetical protein [Flavobacterium sp.]|uniref:hypothetical protein n=1 Tax=Flavobacterium sp. TaxID=239 RepID=UPI002B4B8E22|nr:hypothetical protein [Flavobacterium sp.]HLF50894.1 hypothetical protein [Flavobacterium sp.]
MVDTNCSALSQTTYAVSSSGSGSGIKVSSCAIELPIKDDFNHFIMNELLV